MQIPVLYSTLPKMEVKISKIPKTLPYIFGEMFQSVTTIVVRSSVLLEKLFREMFVAILLIFYQICRVMQITVILLMFLSFHKILYIFRSFMNLIR